jgi:hypothetical protein
MKPIAKLGDIIDKEDRDKFRDPEPTFAEYEMRAARAVGLAPSETPPGMTASPAVRLTGDGGMVRRRVLIGDGGSVRRRMLIGDGGGVR